MKKNERDFQCSLGYECRPCSVDFTGWFRDRWVEVRLSVTVMISTSMYLLMEGNDELGEDRRGQDGEECQSEFHLVVEGGGLIEWCGARSVNDDLYSFF